MLNNKLAEIDNIEKYRRYLPHWRAEGVTYFVTWRLQRSADQLMPDERSLVGQTIEHFNNQRYALAGYVVMDDHVHIIVKPFFNTPLQGIVHSWKSFSARQLQRNSRRFGAVWEQEYFDRIIRDSQEFGRQLQYISNNPTKRWPETTEYQWLRLFDV